MQIKFLLKYYLDARFKKIWKWIKVEYARNREDRDYLKSQIDDNHRSLNSLYDSIGKCNIKIRDLEEKVNILSKVDVLTLLSDLKSLEHRK